MTEPEVACDEPRAPEERIPSEATERRALPVPDILTPPAEPVTQPRRDHLADVPAVELRQRIRLALSLLGHRADDDEVLHTLLRQVLTGVPLTTLAGGAH
jgi:hypothetical protein